MLLGTDIQTHSYKIQAAATDSPEVVQQSRMKHRPNTTHKLLSFWLAPQSTVEGSRWHSSCLCQVNLPDQAATADPRHMDGDLPATWSGVLATHPSAPDAPRDPLQPDASS